MADYEFIIPGDTNGDGVVDGLDYDNLVGELGMTEPPDILTADFNNDDRVNLEDFAILRGRFGFGVELALDGEFGATTPEPATLGMLVLGGLLAVRQRKRGECK